MYRTCGGEVFFDEVEKEAQRRLLWKMSEFHGVRLVTYCVMGNHFHALVEVPNNQLWMERIKSVVVEAKGEPLHTMAAYIDLNPVRAGLVEDPKDYRWSGYREAMGGSRRAQGALSKVTGKSVDGWESAGGAEMYHCLLYSTGGEVRDGAKPMW